EVPERGIEPRAVAHDRATDAWIEIVVLRADADVRQRVRRIERAVAGEIGGRAGLTDARRVAVVRDPRLRREIAKEVAMETVAAVLRDHVHAHAALAHFGRVGAGDVAEFLEAA